MESMVHVPLDSTELAGALIRKQEQEIMLIRS